MTNHLPTRLLIATAATASALLIASCGTGGTDKAGSSTTSADTSAAARETSAATGGASGRSEAPKAGGGSENCRVRELQISVGEVTGAAGSREIPLVFVNTGSRTCVLDGFPGVSYVATPAGAQIGAAATRSDVPIAPVSLAPGARATAALRATVTENYPPEQCGPTPVAGFRIFPPNDTGSIFVAYPTSACSKVIAGTSTLSVRPVIG